MHTHTTHLRVRYAETDKMGYLYYGHYPKYYEVGRVELLRDLGWSYRQMEDEAGIGMPVMSLDMRYVRPAYYDDLLTIVTTLRRPPGETVTFHVEVKNERGKLVNGGRVKLCFIELATGKRVPPPQRLLDLLRSSFDD